MKNYASNLYMTLIRPLVQAEAIAIAAGYMHTCAVVSSGNVSCWGYNQYGQLGTGDTQSCSSPTLVSGLRQGKNILLPRLQTLFQTITGNSKQRKHTAQLLVCYWI